MRKLVTVAALVSLALAGELARAAEPSAHDPQFSNKQVWPNLTGKESFAQQKWDKARLLVWAHAGKAAKNINPLDAANWLEDDKPAATPPDKDTDILIPAGSSTPNVGPKGRGTMEARHVTVEQNARFNVQNWVVWGNIWLKGGALLRGQSGTLKGQGHTFLRGGGAEPALLGHWILVQKTGGGSVEFLGNVGTEDELKFNEGVAIVGPDSLLTAGPPSVQVIGPEAILEIQSGGYFGKRANRLTDIDVLVLGELRGGSPARPLTRDAALGVSVKLDQSGASPSPQAGKAISAANLGKINVTARGVADATGNCGMLLAPAACIAVHTKDPAKARLVIRWHGNERAHIPGGAAGAGLTVPENYAKEINVILLGKTATDGIMFDHVRKGGIVLPDPSSRSQWKNVFYGPNCAGKPDELFAKYEGADLQLK